ncbi:hypothetical protein BJY59DRAFT_702244 [Rhodotorula toruloides]
MLSYCRPLTWCIRRIFTPSSPASDKLSVFAPPGQEAQLTLHCPSRRPTSLPPPRKRGKEPHSSFLSSLRGDSNSFSRSGMPSSMATPSSSRRSVAGLPGCMARRRGGGRGRRGRPEEGLRQFLGYTSGHCAPAVPYFVVLVLYWVLRLPPLLFPPVLASLLMQIELGKHELAFINVCLRFWHAPAQDLDCETAIQQLAKVAHCSPGSAALNVVQVQLLRTRARV